MIVDAKERIRKNLITKETTLELNFCDIQGTEIELNLLAQCAHLVALNLNNNCIKDISFLANLKHLEYLYINDNPITDLSVLIKLKHLYYLSLGDNQFDNLFIIQQLKELDTLFLGQNPITDYSVLKELTQLEYLYLENTVQNINLLKELNNLRGLEMDIINLTYPPIWYAALKYKKGKLGNYTHLTELPQIEKIWQLMKTEEEENINLAQQLSKGQGWTEEEFEMYKILL